MGHTRWWSWVQRNLDARGWTNADLARAARQYGTSVDESVIGRWKNKGATPEPQSVRAVARAFGRDIREAVVVAGLLTTEELQAPWADPSEADLSVIPDELILDEIRARMSARRPRPGRKPRGKDTPAGDRTQVAPSTGSDRTTVHVDHRDDGDTERRPERPGSGTGRNMESRARGGC